jgi:adenylate cyclase
MAESGGTRLGGGWRTVLLELALAAIVAGVLTALAMMGFKPEGPDAWTYDWRTYLFSKRPPAPRSDIAIVLIGEESLAEYDYLSPIDRGLTAKLVRALDEARPKAIGIDFLFDRKSENAKTQALLEALKTAHTPIVIGTIDARTTAFKENSLRYQDEFIKASGARTGHTFFARDIDKMKISEQVVRYIGEPLEKSLAAVLANLDKPRPAPSSSYIAWLLEPPGGDLFPIFRVPRHMPDAGPDVILPPRWRKALEGRIVLVGGEFADRDRHLTPLSIWDGRPVPGVMIQAHILAQFLDGRSIREVPRGIEFVLLMLGAFLGFLISRRLPGRRFDWLFYGAGIAVLVAAGIGLFWAFSIVLPTTMLFFAWTAGVSGARYAGRVLRWLGIDAGMEPPATALSHAGGGQESSGRSA